MPRSVPARFPPHGAWPAVMKADLTAAFFDCRDTAELTRQILRGDIPQPTAERRLGKAREPLWALDACRQFVASRHGVADRAASEENVIDLL